MSDSPAAASKPSTPSSEAYCPTHDLFGCPFCHGAPVRTEFRSAAHREAYFAHLAPDDPVRRAGLGTFDFPNIPDEHEAGYDRRA